MALSSEGRLTLNPNAPLFISAAVLQVEDFSLEWGNLVNITTWFGNYWLCQQKEDDINVEDNTNDITQALPDNIDLGADEEILTMEAQFEEFLQSSEAYDSYGLKSPNGITENESEHAQRESPPVQRELARNWEKPARIVGPKYNPRFIQQLR